MRQLKVGGRMVVPVGPQSSSQMLVQVWCLSIYYCSWGTGRVTLFMIVVFIVYFCVYVTPTVVWRLVMAASLLFPPVAVLWMSASAGTFFLSLYAVLGYTHCQCSTFVVAFLCYLFHDREGGSHQGHRADF